MRLIDADELKGWLKSPAGFRTNCEYCTSIDCLDCINEEAIENAPTVDAVEVVRCKECVWCHPIEDLNYCENPNTPWINDPDYDDITVADNDFCSYGERG